MYKIISALIISILIFSGGMFAGYKLLPPKQIIKEVIVVKNIDRLVYRDYSKVDCCEIAKKYVSTPFRSEYKVNSMTAE
jgi:hypothetical protein